ncbi:MAG: multiheme c-type cytochrome [Bacteroidota bacterium]|nr:multiheme c-type cytochrome [Bacteroidota bacterium]
MKQPSLIQIILLLGIIAGTLSCEKATYQINDPNAEWSVFAWSDAGMNWLNPTYDKLVMFPPYSTLRAQVIKRRDPPEIVTEGIRVSYLIIDNKSSFDKRSYGGFWENVFRLFGIHLASPDVGLKGFGLNGFMKAGSDYFSAEGIPVVPVDDIGNWNPYQIAEITVLNSGMKILAQTQCTIPTSDEINCAKCHGANAFDDILAKHDDIHHTTLSTNKPVLCASCHPSPAPSLGINTGRAIYLSRAIHLSHSSKQGITCYDCHPGTLTKFNRSLRHTTEDGNCKNCHGDMANVANTILAGRIPWNNEPACINCHEGVAGVNTGTSLYRDSQGHGNMYCASCHGSPHAMMPSREASDNYQSKQYEGFTSRIKSIGSCGVCHDSSKGESNISEFTGAHGGRKPEISIGCRACHTSIPVNTAEWPHAFTWNNSN